MRLVFSWAFHREHREIRRSTSILQKKNPSAKLVCVGLCWLVRLTPSFKGPLLWFHPDLRRFPHFPFSVVSRTSGGGGLFARRRIFNRQVCVCVAWTVRWSALRGITKYDEYTIQHLPTDTLLVTPCNRICRTSARAHTSSHVYCVLRMSAAEIRAFLEDFYLRKELLGASAHSGADWVAGTLMLRYCQVLLMVRSLLGASAMEVRGCCSSHSSSCGGCKFRRGGRPISVSTVAVGPSIDICRSFWIYDAGFMPVAWWTWPLYPLPYWC